MAKLYFRYGAMGSSKTANAIMVQYNYRERGQNALMLKPCLDNRDGERIVGSRSGLSAPCKYVEELPRIDIDAYDCVIVDECQFLTRSQVETLVEIVDEKNIPVICYGLRADFRGELFEGSKWLLAWADTIEEIKTVCWCGRKATFNARVVNGQVARDGAQIQLGGNESYVALCRRHWKTGELAPEEIRRISIGKKAYLDLMLEADPSETMIDRYLEDGELFVLLAGGKAMCEAVVLMRDEDTCELMNLATRSGSEGKGYASRMLRYLMKLYTPRCRVMEVGTDESHIAFYQRFGFEPAHVRKDFFTDNYDPPIIEGGRMLRDMTVLSKGLR